VRSSSGYRRKGRRGGHALGRLLQWNIVVGTGNSPGPPKLLDNDRERSAQDHQHRNQGRDRKASPIRVEIPNPRR
jgi:hypothetical protein